MKPLLLKMAAFGPYRHLECIDFTLLGAHDLFVIAGQTGAGKTTLLDAMSYALYGQPSGRDRQYEVASLRSHYAMDTEPTFVEFTFQKGGHVWRVMRQMAYRSARQKKESGFKAELYAITEQGSQLLCARKNEVDAEIVRLIGLKHEQFCQIVLLPQGEFASLLTAKSEEKEAILRTLFPNDFWKRLEEQAKEQLHQAKKAHQEAHIRLRSLYELFGLGAEASTDVHAIDPQEIIELLRQQERQLQQAIEDIEPQCVEHHRQLQHIEDQLRTLQWIEQEYAVLDRTEQEYEALYAQQADIEESRYRLLRATEAQRLSPVLTLLQQSREKEATVQKRKNQEDETLAEALRQKDALDQQLPQMESYQTERVEQQQAVQLLERILPQWKAVHTVREEWTALEQEQERLRAELIVIEETLQSCNQAYQAIVQQREAVSALSDERLSCADDVRQVQELDRWLSLYQRCMESCEEEERKLQQLLVQRTGATEAWENSETALSKQQASQLAHKLLPGVACWVCGSLEHPHPATTVVPFDRDHHEHIQKQWLDSEKRVAAQQQVCDHQHQQREDMEQSLLYAWQQYDTANVLLFDLRDASDRMQAQQQVQAQWQRLLARQQQIEAAEVTKQACTDQLHRVTQQREQQQAHHTEKQIALAGVVAKLSEKKNAYHQLLEHIPEPYRSNEPTRHQYEQLAQRLQFLNDVCTDFVQKKTVLVQKIEKSTLEQQHCEQSLRDHRQQYDQILAQFFSQKEQCASEEEALQSLLPPDVYEQLRQSVSDHDKKINHLAMLRETMQKKLVGVPRPDVSPIIEQRDQQQQKLLQKQEEQQRLSIAREQIEKQIHTFGDAVATEIRHAQVLAEYDHLYETIHGTGKNPMRLSLERYILIEYFERILLSANVHFHKLTSGQYQFFRRQERARGNASSGLDLNVYDAYTGQSRDVRTLSGGEKFHAALSLALGMVDCLQTMQGGVHLDLMLIDEGFGSLDEEALQKAIATLLDLHRSGRMIGVISHVSEVQRALPAKLLVEKTKEGWSRTRLVVP